MFVRLEDIARGSHRARESVLAARSGAALPIQFMTEEELLELPEDVLDEALRDWLAKAKTSASRAVKAVAKRIAQALGKKKKPAPPKPEPRIRQRQPGEVRAKGKPGGIPKPPPPSAPQPLKPPPMAPSQPPTKPQKPQYTWDELQKARQAAEKDKDPALWPANWDTTAPGPPVSAPAKGEPSEFERRRQGPKGKPGKYKPAVAHADLYKHMVRAIYVNGKQRGYAFRETPALSSQKIARAMLIKWGYAKRASKAGGVPDRRRIEMTPKGQKRSFFRHSSEPSGVKRAKDMDYMNIVAQSPL